jgi:hypothetical protein
LYHGRDMGDRDGTEELAGTREIGTRPRRRIRPALARAPGGLPPGGGRRRASPNPAPVPVLLLPRTPASPGHRPTSVRLASLQELRNAVTHLETTTASGLPLRHQIEGQHIRSDWKGQASHQHPTRAARRPLGRTSPWVDAAVEVERGKAVCWRPLTRRTGAAPASPELARLVHRWGTEGSSRLLTSAPPAAVLPRNIWAQDRREVLLDAGGRRDQLDAGGAACQASNVYRG